jgi:hypothetical protein
MGFAVQVLVRVRVQSSATGTGLVGEHESSYLTDKKISFGSRTLRRELSVRPKPV